MLSAFTYFTVMMNFHLHLAVSLCYRSDYKVSSFVMNLAVVNRYSTTLL